MTRLGDFVNFFADKISYKSSPNVLITIWSILNNTTFILKILGYFLVNSRTIWQLLIPSSGHTSRYMGPACRHFVEFFEIKVYIVFSK